MHRTIFFMVCMWSAAAAAVGSQSQVKQMVRAAAVSKVKAGAGAIAGAIGPGSAEELKQRLSEVIHSENVQQMMKDPQLKDGLWGLLHNPEAVGQLTNDPQLASSLEDMLERDPHFLDSLLQGSDPTRNAGGEGEHVLMDLEGATVEEIHSEFARLEKDDKAHASQLHESQELRKSLKRELELLVQSVADENDLVTRNVSPSGSLVSVTSSGNTKVEDFPEELDHDGEKLDPTPESKWDVGSVLVEHTSKLRELIDELHNRDAKQMAALRVNAKVRRSLKSKLQKHIKEQQAELDMATKDEEGAFATIKGDAES